MVNRYRLHWKSLAVVSGCIGLITILPNASLSQVAQAAQSESNSADTYNKHGYTILMSAKKVDDVKKAIADFDQAISLDPKFIDAYYNRGNAYLALHEPLKAIEDYNEILTIGPKNGYDVLRNRTQARMDAGQYEKAIQDATTLIESNPKHEEFFTIRGLAYAHLGQYQRSVKEFDQSLKMKPDNAPTLLMRAACNKRIGQSAKARQDLAEAQKLAPNFKTLEFDTFDEQVFPTKANN